MLLDIAAQPLGVCVLCFGISTVVHAVDASLCCWGCIALRVYVACTTHTTDVLGEDVLG